MLSVLSVSLCWSHKSLSASFIPYLLLSHKYCLLYRLLYNTQSKTSLDLLLLTFVVSVENPDSSSRTKFTEDFIRKMEEWEQKKFGLSCFVSKLCNVVLFFLLKDS